MSTAGGETDHHYSVEGAFGTIAEQNDEAFYDDRSDADDDLEKGRIKFPKDELYGREKELTKLCSIYDGLAFKYKQRLDAEADLSDDKDCGTSDVDKHKCATETPPSFDNSRIVFLSGYSGIGKSALVNEFTKQIQGKYTREEKLTRSSLPAQDNTPEETSPPVLCISGKYCEQSSAVAPFSAISEALEDLSLELCKNKPSEFDNTDNTDESGEDNKVPRFSTLNLLKRVGLVSIPDHDLDIDNEETSKAPDFRQNARKRIRESSVIGPGTDRNRVLRGTFSVLKPFLDSCENSLCASCNNKNAGMDGKSTSDYAMKESTLEFMSLVCGSFHHPLILFLDDLQWVDTPSLEMLLFLLTDKGLRNIMVICAYRSNEVHEDHPFHEMMRNVEDQRSRYSADDGTKSVERMDLFSLSLDTISHFIADSISKEHDEVVDLAEVVYHKTMGNIFYVMQAIEELARKNALYYDVMCFEWRWTVSKVELSNFMSDDVVDSVKGKMKELSVEMQRLLVVMGHIPNALDVPLLKVLMDSEGFSMEEMALLNLLKQASHEGMILFSVEAATYKLAHDRIRQASKEFIATEERDGLLLRISNVLSNIEQGPQTEWCLYVAVDHLNSIPPEKMNRGDLAKLNLKVSKISKSRGAKAKENELLREGFKCLESSEIKWKEYDFTLELCMSVVFSEFSLGHLRHAMVAINEVLENAKTMEDKFDAYVHRMLCQCGETRDYALGVVEGIKILSMYGLADIPLTPSIADIAIEKMRVKLALRNRSYSHLISLPIKDAPMFELFGHVTRFASFASKEIILKIVSWRAIRFAIENGINRHLPGIIVPLGVAYNKQGEIKKAYSLGNVAVLMAERFRSHKGDYACSKFAAYAGIMCQLESFKSVSETLLPCINDLKLVGNSEMALGCSLSYFNSCFAAGLPLTSLLDSNLIATEEFAERTEKPTFVATFQMQRQFLLNLKKKSENPTEFNGEAFREEETLSKMDGAASKMTLRDSSSYRLQLAFIFWDEDCMTNMLRILAVYPNSDVPLARLYNRLCFVGLASFAMGKKRNNESFLELGEDCLSYFKRLAKLFSFNARPIYSLLKAMKYQTKQAFEKAIERCMESEVTHLKAIASERYGVFLLDHDDATLAEDYITSAYWFYCDWGAHAKAAKMKHDYLFLRSITRRSSFMKKLTMASSCRTDIQPSKDKRQSLSTRLLLSNPNFAVNFHKRK